MPGEPLDLTRVGQAAVELPQSILSVEAQHLNEKMGVLNTEVQKLGAVLPMGLPPLPSGVGELALPELPGMPGMQGMPGMPGVTSGAGAVKETVTPGKREVKTYMEV